VPIHQTAWHHFPKDHDFDEVCVRQTDRINVMGFPVFWGVIFFCLVSRGTRLCLKLLFAVGVKNAYACNQRNICVCRMHSFALCVLERSFPTEMIICLPSEMNFTNQSLDAHICVTVK